MINTKKGSPVIINADDFGYHSSIDQGILELIRHRRIRSVSAIVTAHNILNAAIKIQEIISNDQSFLYSLSIGLHFNITEGTPLSKSIVNSQLVQDGKFIGKPKIFEIANKNGSFSSEQIEEELVAQVNKFINIFGRKPSHIDGHNHAHLIPNISPIIAKTMSSLGIYRTRIPIQKLDKIALPINNMFLDYATKARQFYNEYGILYCKQFVGLESFGNLSSSILLKAIHNQELQTNGSVQMMCHPGYPASQGSEWIRSEDRRRQKDQLSSQQFQQLAKIYPLSSYYDLSAYNNDKNKILICLQQSKQIKLEAKESIEMRVWLKDSRIANKVNKIDIISLITHLHINKIVQIYSDNPSEYIRQAASQLAIPLQTIQYVRIGQPNQTEWTVGV